MSVRTGRETGWSVLDSRVLCDSPHLSVHHERIATPTRPDGVDWMVVRRREAAVVAPRASDGRFFLIRQERVAILRETWEFPAGQVDGEAGWDAIQETARREMGEEAGLAAPGELISLGSFFSSVGFTDERMHLFLAPDAAPRPDAMEPDEHEAILEVRAFSAAELREMVGDGAIVDSNTLALYARLSARGMI